MALEAAKDAHQDSRRHWLVLLVGTTDACMSKKMETISYTENILPEFNNADHIRRSVAQNINIWNRPGRMVIRPITYEYMPAWLVDNQDRFEDLIKQ